MQAFKYLHKNTRSPKRTRKRIFGAAAVSLCRSVSYISILAVLILVSSCRKDNEIIEDIIYEPIYQVDSVILYASSAQKTKQKSLSQFISILYADLFQTTISSKELNESGQLYSAIGDKGLFTEIPKSNFIFFKINRIFSELMF